MRPARSLALLGLGALVAAGCATGPVPHENLVAAESSSRAAEEVGANQDPQAALYLRQARDETDQARQLIKAGENDRASGLLQRAQADAELAVATARSDRARQEADAAMSRVNALKQQQGQ